MPVPAPIRRLRWALALMLAGAPFGCLGGQTGQPTADTGSGCNAPTVEVPVDRPVRTVVPIEAAQALEGTHTLPLVWVDEDGVPLPNVPEDELTLTFTYDGGIARYNPCGHGGPDIEMTLDVVTRDSGLADSGTAWVSFFPPRSGPDPYGPSGESGRFSLTGASAVVVGTLLPNGGGAVGSGSIDGTTLDPPFDRGLFPGP